MMFETDRLTIRSWQDSDRDPFAAMGTDPRVMAYLGPHLSHAQSDAAIDRQLALTAAGQPAFWATARKSDGTFIGFIGVKAINFETDFTPGYEIGWRLCVEAWGNGYASEGAAAALDFAFGRWQMPKIYSFTVPKNIKSQAVMERIGMERVDGGGFDHPNLRTDDPLRAHILYAIDNPAMPKTP